MPQAVTPIRPLVASHAPNYSYLDTQETYTSPPRFYRRDPHDWDPERISKHILRHGPPEKSPVLAKLVLDNKVDGHAVMETPKDVLLCGLNIDEELQESLMSTLESLRAKSRYIPPSTKRTPNVRDIAKALGEYYGVALPPLAPPGGKHDPGPSSPPSSPPQWELNSPGKSPPDTPDYLRTPPPVSRYNSSQSSADSLLQFSTPSTGPQTLLHPVFPVSPEASHALSALRVPDRHTPVESTSPSVPMSNPISPLNVGVHLGVIDGEPSRSLPTASTPGSSQLSPPHKVIQTSLPIRKYCEVAIQTDVLQDAAVQTDTTLIPQGSQQDVEIQVELGVEKSVGMAPEELTRGPEDINASVDTITSPAEAAPFEAVESREDAFVKSSSPARSESSTPEPTTPESDGSSLTEEAVDEGRAQAHTGLTLPIGEINAANISTEQFITPNSDIRFRSTSPEDTASEDAEAHTTTVSEDGKAPSYDEAGSSISDVYSSVPEAYQPDVDIVEQVAEHRAEEVEQHESITDVAREYPPSEPVVNETPPNLDTWEPVDHEDTLDIDLVDHDLSDDTAAHVDYRSSMGTFKSAEGGSFGEDSLEDLAEEVFSSEQGEPPEPLLDASVLSPTVVGTEFQDFHAERPLSIPSLSDDIVDLAETLSEAETIPDEHDAEVQKHSPGSVGRSSPFEVVDPSLSPSSSPKSVAITLPSSSEDVTRDAEVDLEAASAAQKKVSLASTLGQADDEGVLVSSSEEFEPIAEPSPTPSPLVHVDAPSPPAISEASANSETDEDGVLVSTSEAVDSNKRSSSSLIMHVSAPPLPEASLPEVSITPAPAHIPQEAVASPTLRGIDVNVPNPAVADIFSPKVDTPAYPLPLVSPFALPITTPKSPQNLRSPTPLNTVSRGRSPAVGSDPSPTGGASAGLQILAPIQHSQERSMEFEDLNDWHNVVKSVREEEKVDNSELIDRLETGRGTSRSRSISPMPPGRAHTSMPEEPVRPPPSQVLRSPNLQSRLQGALRTTPSHQAPEDPANPRHFQAWHRRPPGPGTPPPRQLEAGLLAHPRREASPAYDSGDAADSSDFDVESQLKSRMSLKRKESKKSQNPTHDVRAKLSGLLNTWF